MHGEVTDAKVRRVIDAVVARQQHPILDIQVSLHDLGFQEVGIDDGWQACGAGRTVDNRSSFHALDGTPLVNLSRFPSLPDLVAYGHGAGLRMGWYDNNCICMDEYVCVDVGQSARRRDPRAVAAVHLIADCHLALMCPLPTLTSAQSLTNSSTLARHS